MELIKVNSTKLKIILSPTEIQKLGLNIDNINCEETLSMKALREILETAKNQTGFDSGTSQLYVQFYPSKDGSGEMYITRKTHSADLTKRYFGDTSYVSEHSTYTAIFTSSENLIALCKRLSEDNYSGDSTLYSFENKYILVLNGLSYSGYHSYLSEYSNAYVTNDITLAFLEEHAKLLCKNNTVEIFCEIFSHTI